MTAPGVRGLQPTSEVLPAGTRVVAVNSPTTPAVTISAALHAGSLNDPSHLPGVAYFLSRVIDRGTAQRSGDTIAEELDLRGISLRINVTRHALMLSCDCLTEDFDAVLSLVADVVRNPACAEKEVEARRGEIMTALRQDDDNPAVTAVNRLMMALYGDGHPYAHAPKGTTASLPNIARDNLRQFHADRVSPSGLTVVVVGDVSPRAAVDSVARCFGDWQHEARPALDLASPSPATARQRIVVPMMGKSQADIAYGFTTIPRSDPSYYAYWLLVNILGQYGMGGRLGRQIRERQGMAYYAFCGFEASVIAGPLLVRAGVNAANVDRAVASIDHEIVQMATEGVTDDELADSKRYLIGSLPRTLETNAGIAAFLQNALQFELGLDFDAQLPSRLNSVTREEVHAAARQTLSPDRATVVIAGPYDA